MTNKSNYRGAFDEVHIPEELLGKVMDMNNSEKVENKKNRLRVALAGLAAFALCMVVSNGICYAATGETWVTKVIVMINGEEQEQEITWREDESGDFYLGESDFTYQDDDGSIMEGTEMIVVEAQDGVDAQEVINQATQEIQNQSKDEFKDMYSTSVVEEDGKIYLEVMDGKADITEDMADGTATVTISHKGVRFTYEVSQTDLNGVNVYNINITQE